MDKERNKTKKKNKIVDENKLNKNEGTNLKHEEAYGYDFVPTLDNSLNIDEQKDMARRLENIEKKRGK